MLFLLFLRIPCALAVRLCPAQGLFQHSSRQPEDTLGADSAPHHPRVPGLRRPDLQNAAAG